MGRGNVKWRGGARRGSSSNVHGGGVRHTSGLSDGAAPTLLPRNNKGWDGSCTGGDGEGSGEDALWQEAGGQL